MRWSTVLRAPLGERSASQTRRSTTRLREALVRVGFRSAVDHLLHVFGVADGIDLELAGGLVQLLDVGVGEVDVGGVGVLPGTLGLARAGDRPGVEPCADDPGERNLTRLQRCRSAISLTLVTRSRCWVRVSSLKRGKIAVVLPATSSAVVMVPVKKPLPRG